MHLLDVHPLFSFDIEDNTEESEDDGQGEDDEGDEENEDVIVRTGRPSNRVTEPIGVDVEMMDQSEDPPNALSQDHIICDLRMFTERKQIAVDQQFVRVLHFLQEFMPTCRISKDLLLQVKVAEPCAIRRWTSGGTARYCSKVDFRRHSQVLFERT